MSFRATLSIVATLAACSGPAARDGDGNLVARWTVGAEPTVQIGVTEGAPDYELFEVNGALRLSDGGIVVSNAGTRELRYYDSTGRFVRKRGGQGGGPGEFRWLRRIYRGDGDSVLALDWAGDRLSLFDAAGTFVRTLRPEDVGAADRPLDAWLYGPYWIAPAPDRVSRAAVEQVLGRLPAPQGRTSLHIVLPAADGAAWIREWNPDSTASTSWTIVDRVGRPVAIAELPARFDLFEADSDFVLGRWRDANDVTFVRLYRVARSDASAPLPGWLARSARDGATRGTTDRDTATVAAALRSLVMAQENHYADHGTYADQIAALPLERPKDVVLIVMSGDRRGWVGAAARDGGGVACGMGVGAATPLGWTEGAVTCGGPLPVGR